MCIWRIFQCSFCRTITFDTATMSMSIPDYDSDWSLSIHWSDHTVWVTMLLHLYRVYVVSRGKYGGLPDHAHAAQQYIDTSTMGITYIPNCSSDQSLLIHRSDHTLCVAMCHLLHCAYVTMYLKSTKALHFFSLCLKSSLLLVVMNCVVSKHPTAI